LIYDMFVISEKLWYIWSAIQNSGRKLYGLFLGSCKSVGWSPQLPV